jgi:hypothetical protein
LTVRMDPVITVAPGDDYPWKMDSGGSGDVEELTETWVEKGKIRLLIQDLNKSNLENGYKLVINWRTD